MSTEQKNIKNIGIHNDKNEFMGSLTFGIWSINIDLVFYFLTCGAFNPLNENVFNNVFFLCSVLVIHITQVSTFWVNTATKKLFIVKCKTLKKGDLFNEQFKVINRRNE